jgi:hypothetical protein
VVGSLIRLRVGRSVAQIPAWDFSLVKNVQTDSEAPIAPYPEITECEAAEE